MAKAYWIACYRQIMDAGKLADYAKLAGPAIVSGGGRILARSTAAKAYEDGLLERTVLIEFDTVEQATAAHDSADYQAALAVLDGAVVRRASKVAREVRRREFQLPAPFKSRKAGDDVAKRVPRDAAESWRDDIRGIA